MKPPPLPGIVKPHRAQKLLVLAAFGFLFAPCGFIGVLLAKRDLREMAAGTRDRAGEPLTRTAKTLGIVAGVVWAIKWALLIGGGLVVYFNWDRIEPHL